MTKNSNAKNPNMRDPGPGLVGREGGTGGGSVGASTADPDLLGSSTKGGHQACAKQDATDHQRSLCMRHRIQCQE